MNNIERTIKISPKGQITLPKKIRDILASDLVRIAAKGDYVTIEPIRDMAAHLQQYSSRFTPLREAREKAWNEVIGETDIRD